MPAKRLFHEKDTKFRLLFEDNPQPMWVFERDTMRFLAVNHAAVQLYGYTSEEFRQMKVNELQVGDSDDVCNRSELPSSTHSLRLWRHRLKSGRLIDVEVAVHGIQYGGTNACLAVLLDVTHRMQLEEQLRQAQKMEAVGMLAGGIAHDFNNLLTIITGYSQLLLNNLGQRDSNRNLVEQIMKAGDRAAALTRQLLAFSRRQVLQPKVLDMNSLISGLASMLRRLIGEDVDLRLVLRPDLGRVNADPGQVEQVVMNLVVNSRDAMPKGGTLTIETANVELDRSYTGTHLSVESGPYVMLAVSDTGTGMDAETRSRLFEPFFTTKHQGRGTGLGLSTVFGIVRQSGGNVEVYSEPSKGTSVKVYLPRIDQPAAVEPEAATPALARGTETILLVEDEEMVRKLVRETLEREGYKVLEAGDPDEARRIADSFTGQIQLMITDVVMPRQSGRDLAEVISRSRPDTRVLFMSGYTDKAMVNSGVLEQGMAFLQKPFTPATLTRKVREVLEADLGGERTRHAGG